MQSTTSVFVQGTASRLMRRCDSRARLIGVALIGGLVSIGVLAAQDVPRAAGDTEMGKGASGAALQAADILKARGAGRGLAVESGSADPGLAIELARVSELRVHRVEGEAGTVAGSRAAIVTAGLSALRVRVEAGPLESLAYPNHAFNVGVCSGLPEPARLKEWARIIRPEGWLFFVAAPGTAAKAGVEEVKRHLAEYGSGQWLEPRPAGLLVGVQRAKEAGAAEWTHYFRDPDNNRYSPDRLIRPPLRPLWYGEPCHPLGDLYFTQALTAGGRLFMTDASPADTTRARLTCLDAYNGVKLWEREAGSSRFAKVEGTKADATIRAFQLPGWVRPGEMAATAERLYLTDGPECLIIGTADGQDLGQFKAPSPTHPSNCWRFVAYQGDLLFGYADAQAIMPGAKPAASPIEAGPPTLFALDMSNGAPCWVRGGTTTDELGVKFGAPLAIGEGRLFVRAGTNLLCAIDTLTGKTVWKAEEVEDPEVATWWEGAVHRGKFLLSKFNMRTWGSKKKLATVTYATADGKPLGRQTTNLEKEVFLNLQEGFLGAPPVPRLGCNYGAAAGPFYFSRNAYTMEATNAAGGKSSVQVSYGGFRAACGVGALPANGLVHVLPNGLGCGCAAYRATVTLEPGPEMENFAPTNHPSPEQLGSLAAGEERAAGPGDWPTYMADAARTGIASQDLSRPLKVAWEMRVAGEPTPCVAVGGQVFLASTDESVYALNAASGAVQWRFQATGAFQAAPAYWNGRVYAGSDDGWLYCLAAADGRLVWRLRAAPSGRKQVAFETLISPWPLRHGMAIEDGQIYFSAGLLPGQEIHAYAADAKTGRVSWRVPVGKSSIIPCGHLVLKPKAVMYPSPGSAAIYHPVFLSRTDGSRQGGGATHADFTECRFVPGVEADDEGYRKGFLVHGGSEGVQRGYRQGVGYSGRAMKNANNYHMFPEPPDVAGTKVQDRPSFGDGHSVLPLFTATDVCFRQKGALLAVRRSEIFKFLDTKVQKGDERDPFIKWRTSDLPCGEAQWLLAGTGVKEGDAVTLLAGGPKGVSALGAADGKVLWSVAWEGGTLPAAVAGGNVYAASADGRVRGLRP